MWNFFEEEFRAAAHGRSEITAKERTSVDNFKHLCAIFAMQEGSIFINESSYRLVM